LIDRIRRLAPDCTIYNHYGPTETTVGVMVHRVTPEDAAVEVLPLSQALANNRAYVLDEALRLSPSAALGELYIGGAQLCRGYLNRDGEGRFVSDPWAPGERLYRTGDLAYVRPEGGIVLSGRADQEVKIQGFRLHPAEVERALLDEPGVRQAALATRPNEQSGSELWAFLVVEVEADLEAQRAAFSRRLAERLPAHMVPARYVLLPELPRLPNGKIDRVALMSSAEAEALQQEVIAPRDDLEFVLAACLSELLGREVRDVESDFFSLGVHSLLVIKLVARIRKLLEVSIAPGLVFDHASVAALASELRRASGDVARLQELAARQRGRWPASVSSNP
jgi:hypothetical protein